MFKLFCDKTSRFDLLVSGIYLREVKCSDNPKRKIRRNASVDVEVVSFKSLFSSKQDENYFRSVSFCNFSCRFVENSWNFPGTNKVALCNRCSDYAGLERGRTSSDDDQCFGTKETHTKLPANQD